MSRHPHIPARIRHGQRLARVSALAILVACTDPGGPSDLPRVDADGPSIRFVSSGDADADGLLDLRIEWADSSGIDVESVEVTSARRVRGTATGNLLGHWATSRVDSSGIEIEETIAQLLPPGLNTIRIRVADRKGNSALDSVTVDLPPAARHMTLESGAWGVPGGSVLCDDGMIYMTNRNAMFVIDPQALTLEVVLNPAVHNEFRWMLCVPGDPNVYTAPYGTEFSRITRTWAGTGFKNFTGVTVLAASRSDPDIYYAATQVSGRVAIIDRLTNRWIGWLLEEASIWNDEWIPSMAVMPNDEKVYVGRQQEGGLLVVDGATGEIRSRIKLSLPNFDYNGTPGSARLSADSRELFISYPSFVDPSVLRIDTETDRVYWRLSLPEGRPGDLALSPSGRRLFVSTSDLNVGVPSRNVLIDVQDWSVIASFERPRADGELRIDGGVVFRADGKLIFCGETGNVGVYINRE